MVKYGEHDFGLKDHTGANLGDIESERFDNTEWLFERLERYEDDYFVSSICECLDKIGISYNEYPWENLLQYRDLLPDSSWDFNLLDMICNHAKEINLENCTYACAE